MVLLCGSAFDHAPGEALRGTSPPLLLHMGEHALEASPEPVPGDGMGGGPKGKGLGQAGGMCGWQVRCRTHKRLLGGKSGSGGLLWPASRVESPPTRGVRVLGFGCDV